MDYNIFEPNFKIIWSDDSINFFYFQAVVMSTPIAHLVSNVVFIENVMICLVTNI